MKIKYTELFIFIVSAELVGALSALITGDFAGFLTDMLLRSLCRPHGFSQLSGRCFMPLWGYPHI